VEVIAAVMAAIELIENYGPVLQQANRGRQLLRETIAFVREHREIDGISAEQRARAYNVLSLEPQDVKL